MKHTLTKTALLDARSQYLALAAAIPGLNGMAFGRKRVNGRQQRRHAAVFFVERKMPLAEIPTAHVLPASLTVNSGRRSHEIPTDVIEAGPLSFLNASCFPSRPMRPGNCVGAAGTATEGTAGAIVTDGVGNRFILSNAHVLDPLGKGGPDGSFTDKILQPSGDGGLIALLERTTPLVTGNILLADAAIARCGDNSDVDPVITDLGVINGLADPIIGTTVRKNGQMTGLSSGTIRHTNGTQPLNGTALVFGEVFYADLGAQHGDSGAAILDDNNNIVGLLFAVMTTDEGDLTVCCTIGEVIGALGLDGWSWT